MKAVHVYAGKHSSLFGDIPQYSALIFCGTEQTTGGTERAMKEVNNLSARGNTASTDYTLQTYAQKNVKVFDLFLYFRVNVNITNLQIVLRYINMSLVHIIY